MADSDNAVLAGGGRNRQIKDVLGGMRDTNRGGYGAEKGVEEAVNRRQRL